MTPALLLLWGLAAEAPVVTYAVHIGVNQAPADQEELSDLAYADDDAARFYELTSAFAERSVLVAALDDPSYKKHRAAAEQAVAPRRSELERVLGELERSMQASRAAGRRVRLLFSFSGHGFLEDGETRLALLDHAVDGAWLEEHVLKRSADEVHLVIDACHAGGLAQGRGVILRERQGEAREVRGLLSEEGLARYPHVGALLASPRGVNAQEWSEIEAGVFTHEVLSALRRAADINGDGAIAYTEVASFLAAANRGVVDERARVQARVLPPRLDPNLALVRLSEQKAAGWLAGRPRGLGHFFVEREDGVRVLDAHVDGGLVLALALPAGRPLFLRTATAEARLDLEPGERLAFDDVDLVPTGPVVTARGSVEHALKRGLFASPFGVDYYLGFVDSQGLPPVAITRATAGEGGRPLWTFLPLTGAATLAGLALVGAAGLGGTAGWQAWVAVNEPRQRPAVEARDRSFALQLAAGGALAVGVGLAAGAALLWPWWAPEEGP